MIVSIKTVLCPVDATNFRKDVRDAISFCVSVGAHLTILAVYMSKPQKFGSYDVISPVWLAEREQEIAQLDAARRAISEMLGASDVTGEVDDVYAGFVGAAEEIARRALYSDLVFIGSNASKIEVFRSQIVDGALLQSPTPLLIDDGNSKVSSGSAVILLAWDSSDEAARAVQQALEFLKAAKSVHVTMIDPIATLTGSGEEPGADIATYLSRHDVNVTVDRLPGGGRGAAEILVQHARDINAQMIVMGAYNHPRVQQRLFGGVTRSMLAHSPVSLFLAH